MTARAKIAVGLGVALMILGATRCFDLTASAGAAGDAFVNLTSQIGLAPPDDDCTDPSTFTSRGTPQNTALTTAGGVAIVHNADDAPGATIQSDPLSGVAFNCTTLSAGSSAGTKLVGAFPAINTLDVGGALLDSVTGFQLSCE